MADIIKDIRSARIFEERKTTEAAAQAETTLAPGVIIPNVEKYDAILTQKLNRTNLMLQPNMVQLRYQVYVNQQLPAELHYLCKCVLRFWDYVSDASTRVLLWRVLAGITVKHNSTETKLRRLRELMDDLTTQIVLEGQKRDLHQTTRLSSNDNTPKATWTSLEPIAHQLQANIEQFTTRLSEIRSQAAPKAAAEAVWRALAINILRLPEVHKFHDFCLSIYFSSLFNHTVILQQLASLLPPGEAVSVQKLEHLHDHLGAFSITSYLQHTPIPTTLPTSYHNRLANLLQQLKVVVRRQDLLIQQIINNLQQATTNTFQGSSSNPSVAIQLLAWWHSELGFFNILNK